MVKYFGEMIPADLETTQKMRPGRNLADNGFHLIPSPSFSRSRTQSLVYYND